MAAVIGRGFERMMGERAASSPSDEVYDPNHRNNGTGMQSPFALYYTVTFFTNGIAIIGGVISQFDLHRNNYYGFDYCDAWLFANAFFGVLHIGAALYIVHKIREPNRWSDGSLDATTYAEDGKGGVYATGYRLHNGNPLDLRNPAVAVASAAAATHAQSPTGPPDSLHRVRYTLCENTVFAGYIFVFGTYLCWHFFLDMRACNLGMAFAMRCADIFIWAAPCSFVFSVATLMWNQGRI